MRHTLWSAVIPRRLSLRRVFVFIISFTVVLILFRIIRTVSPLSSHPVGYSTKSIILHPGKQQTKLWQRTDRLISCQLHARLGNMMFAYASLVGIAKRSDRVPVLPEYHFLRALFHVQAASPQHIQSSGKFKEARSCAYDPETEHIETDASFIELVGYFQSWKYFAHEADQIRTEFTFREEYQKKAAKFMERVVSEEYGSDAHRRDVLIIGIHVRVRDMAWNDSRSRGYTIATPSYLSAAMVYFQSKHSNKKLLFVLVTDDKEWCHDNFPYESATTYPLVHTVEDADILDMAILASCNHTIISVGSFGWWGAWLSNGTTIYYKHFPRPNSSLALEYNLQDYYPPQWIGM